VEQVGCGPVNAPAVEAPSHFTAASAASPRIQQASLTDSTSAFASCRPTKLNVPMPAVRVDHHRWLPDEEPAEAFGGMRGLAAWCADLPPTLHPADDWQRRAGRRSH
jgi:hypothetical protein